MLLNYQYKTLVSFKILLDILFTTKTTFNTYVYAKRNYLSNSGRTLKAIKEYANIINKIQCWNIAIKVLYKGVTRSQILSKSMRKNSLFIKQCYLSARERKIQVFLKKYYFQNTRNS